MVDELVCVYVCTSKNPGTSKIHIPKYPSQPVLRNVDWRELWELRLQGKCGERGATWGPLPKASKAAGKCVSSEVEQYGNCLHCSVA